ncbi:MAG: DUF3575 domain-containing protein [Phocaeicola sp.]
MITPRYFNRLFLLGIVAVMTLLATTPLKAQRLAIKTDLLLLTAMTPNLGMELVVGNRSSFSVGAFFNQKPYGADMKMLGIQPEFRYWFNGRPFTREYVGVAGLFNHYNLVWKDKRYKGNTGGIGVTIGYAWKLNKKWIIEAYGGAGFLYFAHKESYATDHTEDYYDGASATTNSSGFKFLPTKIGASISYIIK